MYIDIDALKEYLLLTAQCDGEAYRDNQNTALAVQRARHAALRSFYKTLTEVNDAVVAELAESWTDESIIEDAKRQVHKAFWKAMDTGNVVSCPERIYEEMLDILPPAWMSGHHFAAGEPLTHSPGGEPVHAFFWREATGIYYAQYQTLITRRTLAEIKRQKF